MEKLKKIGINIVLASAYVHHILTERKTKSITTLRGARPFGRSQLWVQIRGKDSATNLFTTGNKDRRVTSSIDYYSPKVMLRKFC